MKIFLTGGSGFIGSQVLKSLLAHGHEVLTISRRRIDDLTEEANCRQYQADLTCWGTFEQEIQAFAPEACIHAAWIQTHDYSEKICRINHMASLNLLSYCFGLKSVKTVTALGSCLEYGNSLGACSEEKIPEADSWFAWCKNSIRNYGALQAASEQKAFRWCRVFYAYGLGQRAGALIPGTLTKLKAGENPKANAPGTACDFIHVEDIAEGIVRATVEANGGMCALNLGSGKSTTTGNVVDYLTSAWKGDAPLKDFENEGTGNWSDNSKIASILDWKPGISLEEGLRTLVSSKRLD